MNDRAGRDRWHRDLAHPHDPATPTPTPTLATATATATRSVVDTVYDDLVARYAEPHRHYHTLAHVAAVLDRVDQLGAAVGIPPAGRRPLLLAAWFHDVIYDPTRADNEARSAEHFRQVLEPIAEEIPKDELDEAARLIELTAAHTAGEDDATGQVLLDADLSILGAPAEAYDAYRHAIRREYVHVRGADYRRGRTAVLEGFGRRPQIFATAAARGRWEEHARANVQRELRELAGP